MKVLCISDLHGSDSRAFSRPLPNGRASRFQDLLDVLQQVEVLIEEHHPDDLLILGDILHRRHFVRFSLLNDLMAAIYRLTTMVNRTVILVGNHDLEDDVTHGLAPFSYWPNTMVIDQPATVKLSSGDDVYAVPYLSNALAVADAVAQAPSSLPLLLHYASEGVPLESDYYLESPLKIGQLARFPLVLSGHVHKPSRLLDDKVVYVGAVMHFDFGDAGPRYAHLVDGASVHPFELTFPVFETARWPRLPRTEGRTGYLRILDVPRGQQDEAKAYAANLGWLDSVSYEAALPPEVHAAIESGLVVDEALLRSYVQRRCATLAPDEQEALVQEGLYYLQEARG